MIRGTKRPRVEAIEIMEPKAQKIDTELNASIHNRFDVEVIDVATGEVRQRAQAQNVICNALWTRLLAPNTYFNYIHYGTGTGTPAATDTSLFAFSGYGTPAINDVYGSNPGDGYVSVRRQIQLSETTAVGATLTEVGIGYSTAASSLCTHAMLKDMNGNPISINKTDTDIINIYATIFLHWDALGYDNGYICIGSVIGSPFLNWLFGIASPPSLDYLMLFHGGFGPQYMLYANTLQDDSYLITAGSVSYDAINKTITIGTQRLSVTDGNFGGIKTIALGSWTSAFQLFAPAIGFEVGGSWYQGSAIIGEAIGTGDGSTKDFVTAFPFVKSGAKIYIDGVEQLSGVTVDVDTPTGYYTNMGVYFKLLIGKHVNDRGGNIRSSPSVVGSHGVSGYLGSVSYYYNPLYYLGIASFTSKWASVRVSDDLVNWTTVGTSVPEAYRYCKYWEITNTYSALNPADSGIYNLISALQPATNIHFSTAPANGTVITADYTTKTVAKDANHVFDFSCTITLGEQTP